jgi:hypothetical protein
MASKSDPRANGITVPARKVITSALDSSSTPSLLARILIWGALDVFRLESDVYGRAALTNLNARKAELRYYDYARAQQVARSLRGAAQTISNFELAIGNLLLTPS